MDEVIINVHDGGALDVDAVMLQIDVRPSQTEDLGAAKTGQTEEDGDLIAVAFGSIQEGFEIGGGEIGGIIVDDLGETNGYFSASGFGDHGGDKAPGVFQRLGGDKL